MVLFLHLVNYIGLWPFWSFWLFWPYGPFWTVWTLVWTLKVFIEGDLHWQRQIVRFFSELAANYDANIHIKKCRPICIALCDPNLQFRNQKQFSFLLQEKLTNPQVKALKPAQESSFGNISKVSSLSSRRRSWYKFVPEDEALMVFMSVLPAAIFAGFWTPGLLCLYYCAVQFWIQIRNFGNRSGKMSKNRFRVEKR